MIVHLSGQLGWRHVSPHFTWCHFNRSSAELWIKKEHCSTSTEGRGVAPGKFWKSMNDQTFWIPPPLEFETFFFWSLHFLWVSFFQIFRPLPHQLGYNVPHKCNVWDGFSLVYWSDDDAGIQRQMTTDLNQSKYINDSNRHSNRRAPGPAHPLDFYCLINFASIINQLS